MAHSPANPLTPDELRAAEAARGELGDTYDHALTSSLLERLEAQVAQRRGASGAHDLVTIVIALGSIGLGVTFALLAGRLGHLGGTIATIVVWIAIAAINIAHLTGPRRG